MSEVRNPNPPELKDPWNSKVLHFNVWSMVLAHALLPFLPASFVSQKYAVSAVASWFTISNVVLRFFTSEAISFWKPKK